MMDSELCLTSYRHLIELLICVVVFAADFGFARFLQDGVMAATLCGSPMYMVIIDFYVAPWCA